MKTLTLLFASFAFLACNSGPAPRTPPFSVWEAARPSAVSEIRWSRFDPSQGEAGVWTVRLVRLDSNAASNEDIQWKIGSAPQGRELVDSLADSGLIRHVLETLTTLRAEAKAPAGTAESFGLSRPRDSMEWGDHRLLLGNEVKEGGRYARIESTSTQNQDSTVWILRGAALQMIDYIKTFDQLRQRKLLSWTQDDVSAFEVYEREKLVLSAERLSGGWGDKKHRPLPDRLGRWLEWVTHLQIAAFDDSAESGSRALRVQKQPLYRVVFKGRNGPPVVLSLAIKPDATDRVLASASDRTHAVFELPSEILTHFLRSSMLDSQ